MSSFQASFLCSVSVFQLSASRRMLIGSSVLTTTSQDVSAQVAATWLHFTVMCTSKARLTHALPCHQGAIDTISASQ